MKVTCIENDISNLEELLLKKFFSSQSPKQPLFLGKAYTVYAITIHSGYAWYFMWDEENRYYPACYPSPLFEVIGSRLSRYWIFMSKNGNDYIHPNAIWSFPEWAKEDYYYDSLTDGDEREVEIFKQYKERMDLEFPNPAICDQAQIGDEEWLICPYCIDAWQSKNHLDALVRCPKCHKLLNNPRYQNIWPGLKMA